MGNGEIHRENTLVMISWGNEQQPPSKNIACLVNQEIEHYILSEHILILWVPNNVPIVYYNFCFTLLHYSHTALFSSS